jgi:hypothetical protein
MPNFLFALTGMDAFTGLTVKRTLLDLTELIVSVAFPVFVTVTVSVFVLPTGTLPIESVFESTENAPLFAAAARSSSAPGPGGEKETLEMTCGASLRFS